MKEVVVVEALRTPIGSYMGALSSLSAPKIGAIAIKGLIDRTGIAPSEVDEVIMGMVLQGGAGQAPARQAAIYAGLPASVPCMTVHKVCGSGLQSIILGAQSIRLGEAEIVIAGGMESMSNAPYYLLNARTGYRLGDGKLIDGMIHDGLWDPYGNVHMGNCGELCAKEYNFTRKAQDDYAKESYEKARLASKEGRFSKELLPVQIPSKKGEPTIILEDEEPKNYNPDKMGALKPAFEKDGTITAANASKLNDGASALMLMSAETAKKKGLTPLARIHAKGSFAQAPEWFTTAPAEAIRMAVNKTKRSDGTQLSIEDIDFYEINEAFSVVGLANIQLLGISASKVNVHGGAVALGHPIGASGARITTTLIHTLHSRNGKWGVAGICLGGGEGLALVVEKI